MYLIFRFHLSQDGNQRKDSWGGDQLGYEGVSALLSLVTAACIYTQGLKSCSSASPSSRLWEIAAVWSLLHSEQSQDEPCWERLLEEQGELRAAQDPQ